MCEKAHVSQAGYRSVDPERYPPLTVRGTSGPLRAGGDQGCDIGETGFQQEEVDACRCATVRRRCCGGHG